MATNTPKPKIEPITSEKPALHECRAKLAEAIERFHQNRLFEAFEILLRMREFIDYELKK